MVVFQGCYSYGCVSGLLQLQLSFMVTIVMVMFQGCYSYSCVSGLLGGLSLHLNHLIASGMTIDDWPFGTLPFRLFGSNLDTRDLETYPRTYSGHF